MKRWALLVFLMSACAPVAEVPSAGATVAASNALSPAPLGPIDGRQPTRAEALARIAAHYAQNPGRSAKTCREVPVVGLPGEWMRVICGGDAGLHQLTYALDRDGWIIPYPSGF